MSKRGNSKKHPSTGAILPIDLAILEILPDEGQMIGFKHIALQVSSIKERPEFDEVSGNQIGGRLRSMSFQGLTCTQVTLPIQRGLGWQRTAKGKKLLAEKGRVSV